MNYRFVLPAPFPTPLPSTAFTPRSPACDTADSAAPLPLPPMAAASFNSPIVFLPATTRRLLRLSLFDLFFSLFSTCAHAHTSGDEWANVVRGSWFVVLVVMTVAVAVAVCPVSGYCSKEQNNVRSLQALARLLSGSESTYSHWEYQQSRAFHPRAPLLVCKGPRARGQVG